MDKEDVRGLMMELCAVGTDFDQMKVEELHKACAILEHMTSLKALGLPPQRMLTQLLAQRQRSTQHGQSLAWMQNASDWARHQRGAKKM